MCEQLKRRLRGQMAEQSVGEHYLIIYYMTVVFCGFYFYCDITINCMFTFILSKGKVGFMNILLVTKKMFSNYI